MSSLRTITVAVLRDDWGHVFAFLSCVFLRPQRQNTGFACEIVYSYFVFYICKKKRQNKTNRSITQVHRENHFVRAVQTICENKTESFVKSSLKHRLVIVNFDNRKGTIDSLKRYTRYRYLFRSSRVLSYERKLYPKRCARVKIRKKKHLRIIF